jgi:hypothetical protein
MKMRKVLAFGAALALFGCDRGGETKGHAGAATTAPASGGATTKLTKAQLDEAYKLTNPDHYEKSVEKVTAKLGKADKTEATKSTWYGLDGSSCYRLLLTKGSGHETGTTPNANCGLK